MQSLDIMIQEPATNAGVFIDIDGVVLKGGKPFDWSVEAIHKLWDNEIPFCFVTNGTYSGPVLVNTLTNIFNLPFTLDHCIVAPSPCSELTAYHNKHTLVCCQDDAIDLISELGFRSYTTIPELCKVFPELDYVDHNKRKELSKVDQQEVEMLKQNFRPIEAILLLGEPVSWERALQVLLDVLMTNGDPRNTFKFVPYPHLPLIAANKDLTFKGAAALPRFGHGAFLECLETLYNKVTKNELIYEFLMGKPYLITYDFAANQIQRLSKNGMTVNKFYIIGDNPEVDVKGANLFKEHLIEQFEPPKSNISSRISSRSGSFSMTLDQMSIESKPIQNKYVESILVCSGVYQKQCDLMYHLNNLFHEKAMKAQSKEKEQGLFFIEKDKSGSEVTESTESSALNDDAVIETSELKNLLSRRNSFISYFDNKLNIPDLTFDHLLDAVNYIVKNERF